MKFPLVVGDFLDRADHVYLNRVALVDEPDQPTPRAPLIPRLGR
jgi:fatty-acyl-CoA synthase